MNIIFNMPLKEDRDCRLCSKFGKCDKGKIAKMLNRKVDEIQMAMVCPKYIISQGTMMLYNQICELDSKLFMNLISKNNYIDSMFYIYEQIDLDGLRLMALGRIISSTSQTHKFNDEKFEILKNSYLMESNKEIKEFCLMNLLDLFPERTIEVIFEFIMKNETNKNLIYDVIEVVRKQNLKIMIKK